MKSKEQQRTIIPHFLLVIFIMFMLASCATIAARPAVSPPDDISITQMLKARFLEEAGLRGIIVIQTLNGTVTLSGTVETDEQRDRAETVARSEKGVREVRNQLVIKKMIDT